MTAVGTHTPDPVAAPAVRRVLAQARFEAAILLRNVLERRKELALLRAVGYRPRHVAAMVIAENLLLLSLGLATGTICALLAIAPAIVSRGGHLPLVSIGALLAAVLATGILASLAATAAALRSPLLAALGSE